MVFTKDSDATLDYLLDYAAKTNGRSTIVEDWLETGETISSHTLIAPSGITVDSTAATDGATSVTVWLSGGTANNSYTFTCRVTTTGGRTDDRSFVVQVRER